MRFICKYLCRKKKGVFHSFDLSKINACSKLYCQDSSIFLPTPNLMLLQTGSDTLPKEVCFRLVLGNEHVCVEIHSRIDELSFATQS